MEFLCHTEFKLIAPKKGFAAPYIRLPWGYDQSLIGQPVDVFTVDGGLFISLATDKIRSSGKNVLPSVDEFKPSESTNNEHITPENEKATRCYSVDRPIMRAFHARDWGSNPHSSTPFSLWNPHYKLA